MIVVVWTGENDTKTISVGANLFENEAKQLRFRFKTGLVWTEPERYAAKDRFRLRSIIIVVEAVEYYSKNLKIERQQRVKLQERQLAYFDDSRSCLHAF